MPPDHLSGASGTSMKMTPQACSQSFSASSTYARWTASNASDLVGSNPSRHAVPK
jgi:hypothetical protein